jgi:dienelactone hydrolase
MTISLPRLAGPVIALALLSGAACADPLSVTFPGPDGVTLTGYVFAPQGAGRHPAVVMMHGRGGAYSSRAHGTYEADTLSRRHKFWGDLWASQGYVAMLVDDFGPRGFAKGFPRGSYKDRPEAVNEATVRPRDAQAAAAYLRTRPDVLPERIGLHGWSNGGGATLAAMSGGFGKDFRGALSFYPNCGLKGLFDNGLTPYAPVRVFSGEADEEVSTRRCAALVDKSRPNGDISITLYPGATHGFDDPSRKRASVPANAAAAKDATARALAFFADVLKP